MLFMFMNCFLSFMFMSMNHPLSMGCILLMQTILMTLSSGYLYFNFWLSYILFLIMISGMLIMFIYMTSIASNEKFKMPNLLFFVFIIISMPLFSMILLLKDNFYSNLINSMYINLPQMMISINFSMNKFFCYPNMFFMISLMLYLLITLITIVKLTDKNLGTLRQK
uniref:NADH-ubiquinone oxidoreductase chain 6 n=1 Tax=Curculionoidea sp. 4 KM-2017 TaxID=2219417 RepID=A0A346RI81_9CUCU|nr:NADH dehydrogenase subunit 6 [Curculionoidea sp. 4 KM-2017]